MTDGGRWVGAPVPRKEDEALLTGHARFIDDMEPVPGIRHVAMLRSPPCRMREITNDRHVAGRGACPAIAWGHYRRARSPRSINPIPSAVRVPVEILSDGGGEGALHRRAGRRWSPPSRPLCRRRRAGSDRCRLPNRCPPVDRSRTRPLRTKTPHCCTTRSGPTSRAPPHASAMAIPKRPSLKPTEVVKLRLDATRAIPLRRWKPTAPSRNSSRQPDRYTIWSNFQGPFILHALMCGVAQYSGQPAAAHHGAATVAAVSGSSRRCIPIHGAAGDGEPASRRERRSSGSRIGWNI